MTKEQLEQKIQKTARRCAVLLCVLGRSRDNPKSLILRYDRNIIKLMTYKTMLKSYK